MTRNMMKSQRRAALLIAPALLLTGCKGGLDELREMVSANIVYAPSSSMEPTIPINNRFTVYQIKPDALRRGGVYIVQPNFNDTRVLRLIGMPGDIVAMKDGEVVLNGEPLRQESLGPYSFETQYEGTKEAEKLREYLPGDGGSYEVLNLGPTPQDNGPPVQLGPDQFFLLGDNRDNAADSRIEPGEFAQGGIGIVSADKITHRVDMESIAE